VRDGTVIDEYSHILGDAGFQVPRTLRLTHGESKIAGQYDLPSAYQENRPCHDGYPTYVCLQKDHTGRPDYDQAIHLAEYQTAHEWCRLLHLSKDSQYGYAASSILMTLWAKPEDEPFGPHPVSTACGTPLGVLTGKPGPIEVTVDPHDIYVNNQPDHDGGPGSRNLTFALYTGDFRRSRYRTFGEYTDDNRVRTMPITMCVNPADTLVATVWGWDDFNDGVDDPNLDAFDTILRGATWVLEGPDFQPGGDDEEDRDLDFNIDVSVGGLDTDGDGLSDACGETFYGTDPTNPDSDDDGLSDGAEANTYGTDPLDADSDDDGLADGAEVNVYGTDPLDADTDDDGLTDGAEVDTYGTNPLDADTDDDGLSDGAEVDTYGTDPLDADSDDDGLSDGAEVNTYGTDPLDPDTDDDGLDDGIEIGAGTDPLDADSDDDGIPDGEDVEFVQNTIAAVPAESLVSVGPGVQTAMLARLDGIERLIAENDTAAALRELALLRRHLDGCGIEPDRNDWITECADQFRVRELLDLLAENISTP